MDFGVDVWVFFVFFFRNFDFQFFYLFFYFLKDYDDVVGCVFGYVQEEEFYWIYIVIIQDDGVFVVFYFFDELKFFIRNLFYCFFDYEIIESVKVYFFKCFFKWRLCI